MKRFWTVAIVLMLTGSVARGQDIVDYLDPSSKSDTKIEQLRGTIESEGPLGIKVKSRNGPVVDIPAASIRYIRYKAVTVPDIDYRKPFGLEDRALGQTRDEQRKKLLADSLLGFRDLLPKAKEVPAAYRYLQYRVARILAMQADDDHDRLDAAITAFADFTKDHNDGWQIIAALKQLARLQEEKGNLTGASQAFADLARVPGITPAMRQDSEVLGARLLIRAGKTEQAEKKLGELDATLSPGDRAKAAVQVFLAQCHLQRGDLTDVESRVRPVLLSATEPAVIAAGHNVLGDLYLKKGQPEDAFWEYLHVDIQPGGDREEEAKALYHLSQLFDKVKNDRVRAQDCLARLQDKTQFGGTEYHRKAMANKP
jgi:hypothetical protein